MATFLEGLIIFLLWSAPPLTLQQEIKPSIINGINHEISAIQVDSQGNTYLAAGNQLVKMVKEEAIVEHMINLTSVIMGMSISPGGEELTVCMADSSCAIHNTSDLSPVLIVENVTVADSDNVAVITTAGDYFYSYSTRDHTNERFSKYRREKLIWSITKYYFKRRLYFGFCYGDYIYFIGSVHFFSFFRRDVIFRICHNCTDSFIHELHLDPVLDFMTSFALLEQFGSTESHLFISRYSFNNIVTQDTSVSNFAESFDNCVRNFATFSTRIRYGYIVRSNYHYKGIRVGEQWGMTLI